MADNKSPDRELNAPAAGGESAEEFPQKLRVHALARLLGITSKQALAHLADLGFVARSAHSSIDRSAAERVRDAVRPSDAGDDGAAGAEGAAPPSTETAAEPEPAAVEATAPQAAAGLFSALDVAQPVAPPVEPSGSAAAVPLFLQPEQVVLPKEPARRREPAVEPERPARPAAEPDRPARAATEPARQTTEPARPTAEVPAPAEGGTEQSAQDDSGQDDDEGAAKSEAKRS
ncbi:hypothetical protein GCM10023147_19570 [Tsukamurella soli]|uniref:Translation initiation factor IF-2 N-terminal domain-containing protein n=1 Tax=Tsukamurella soli TaxID=644556 RepID=A0ABP8JHS1_9ACTN